MHGCGPGRAVTDGGKGREERAATEREISLSSHPRQIAVERQSCALKRPEHRLLSTALEH
jgi:hypothetical protein